MRNPVALLKELWDELKRRFGSVAVISNTLLQRLQDTTTFEKLPQFICAKWEKEIAHYSNSNGGAYPPFIRFSKIVQEQSKIQTF